MLKLLPEWLKIGGALVVGALVAIYPAILVGRSEGRQQAATQALETAVKRFAEKGKIKVRFLLLMPLLCATISGCQTATKPIACAGFEKLQPSLETSVTILTTDRPFANQVASHNRFGKSQGCWN
ncbi:hypothetical protein AJ87_03045 [Rhizobium yanglingense]|nr:hypothetical protein AJ87_03045 [Rhizobium yanglingense]